MGLFSKLFGKSKDESAINQPFFGLSGYAPVYTTFDGGMYEVGLCKACIHRKAAESAKACPTLFDSNENQDRFKKYLISKKPNDFMTAYQFYYRLRTIYEVENNAYIAPIEDDYGKLIGLYPVAPSLAELREKNGIVYIVYTFGDGNQKAIEYDKVGHLKKMQYKNDFFGDTNAAFQNTLDLVNAQELGSAKAIKAGANIRFMGKLNNILSKDEDIKKQKDQLYSLNLYQNNESSIFLYDNRFEDMKPIENRPVLLDAEQKKAIDNSVFDYFGVNEEVLQCKYDEDTWNAFYESELETYFIQLGEVLADMLYSKSQIMNGKGVVIASDRLQYASNKTKVEIVTELVDRGMLLVNQGLSILNLPPVPDGDVRIIRGEYINMNQLGKGVSINAEQAKEANARLPDDSGGDE